ncbi:S1 RNA-binding domain-containing protein [Holzapfeliella sp. JNUCC 80]
MIKQGQRLKGTINNVASFGVFVTLAGKHHGLIKRQELEYGKNDDWQMYYDVNQEIDCVVLSAETPQKIALSQKQYDNPELKDLSNPLEADQTQSFSKKIEQVLKQANEFLEKYAAEQ